MNNPVLIFKLNPFSRGRKQCGGTSQLVVLKHPHDDDDDDDEDDHDDDFHGYLRGESSWSKSGEARNSSSLLTL